MGLWLRKASGSEERGASRGGLEEGCSGTPPRDLSGGKQVVPFGEGPGSWKQVSSCMRNWYCSVLRARSPFNCACYFSAPEGKPWRAETLAVLAHLLSADTRERLSGGRAPPHRAGTGEGAGWGTAFLCQGDSPGASAWFIVSLETCL